MGAFEPVAEVAEVVLEGKKLFADYHSFVEAVKQR